MFFTDLYSYVGKIELQCDDTILKIPNSFHKLLIFSLFV